jgi:hypothetical protein
MKCFLLLFTLCFLSSKLFSQQGCTDPKADNYNSLAVSNDGSCTYPATTVALTSPVDLPATINETSGLVNTGGDLWTFNDSGNPNIIYKIDPANGHILQTVTVSNATNTDWEAITADADYLYIGDFGNNASGNRTNLTVWRITKADITAGSAVSVTASAINFSYQDQVISGPVAANTTNYDCEAFLVKDGVLHLFTKEWTSGHTRHYTLSATPGTYSITAVEDYNVTGLITDAGISSTNQIVLIGYTQSFEDLFMYLLYDYAGNNFFSGNKRRLNLGKSISPLDPAQEKGQIEGVSFTGNASGYVSSERINQSGYIVNPRLYSFTVSNLLSLPVQLLSFNAEYKDPEVVLTWQTASEMNSRFFSIERSADAIQFKQIGIQQAKGNSNTVVNYQYSDKYPEEGNNYYRLKQVDIDGNRKLYQTRAVKVARSHSNKLKAYVESSQAHRLVIDLGRSPLAHTTFQLISMNGSIQSTGLLQSQRQWVNIDKLPKGQYVVKMSSGQTAKFIR